MKKVNNSPSFRFSFFLKAKTKYRNNRKQNRLSYNWVGWREIASQKLIPQGRLVGIPTASLQRKHPTRQIAIPIATAGAIAFQNRHRIPNFHFANQTPITPPISHQTIVFPFKREAGSKFALKNHRKIDNDKWKSWTYRSSRVQRVRWQSLLALDFILLCIIKIDESPKNKSQKS